MSQDLIEAAEPWRQNEFSKKDLKKRAVAKACPFYSEFGGPPNDRIGSQVGIQSKHSKEHSLKFLDAMEPG